MFLKDINVEPVWKWNCGTGNTVTFNRSEIPSDANATFLTDFVKEVRRRFLFGMKFGTLYRPGVNFFI